MYVDAHIDDGCFFNKTEMKSFTTLFLYQLQ